MTTRAYWFLYHFNRVALVVLATVTAGIVALLIAGCTIQVLPAPVYVEYTPPAEDPPTTDEPAASEPDPVPVPPWQAVTGHIYTMDVLNTIIWDYDAIAMGYTYAELWHTAGIDVESHNLFNPGNPWHLVGGGSVI